MGAATGEIHIVILTDTCFEYFFKPVGIGVVLEMIFSGGTVQLVTAGQRLVFLTAFGSDDDHTVGGARTVDGSG